MEFVPSPLSSVKKKLKALVALRGQDQADDVYQGAERLGVNLDDQIQLVIDALKRRMPASRHRRDARIVTLDYGGIFPHDKK